MKHNIFLSYRRSDREIARALVNALETKGLDVWWDDEIEGGVDWRDDIVENLTNSSIVVILFSEECNNSKQLKKELAIADQMDKNVIPVLIEDTTPKGHYLYELASRNWIQIHPEAMTKIDRLVEKLVAIAGIAPSVTERSTQPAEAAQEPGHSAPQAAAQHIPELVVEQSALAPANAQNTMAAAPAQIMETANPAAPPSPASIEIPKTAEPDAKTVTDQNMPDKKEDKIGILLESFPFRRKDWIPFSLFGLLFLYVLYNSFNLSLEEQELAWGDLTLISIFPLIYGIVVFPIRYFQQHLRLSTVAKMLSISNLVLLIPLAVTAIIDPKYGGLGQAIFMTLFGVVISVGISLAIYAVAYGQRALRNFRSNVEKL